MFTSDNAKCIWEVNFKQQKQYKCISKWNFFCVILMSICCPSVAFVKFSQNDSVFPVYRLFSGLDLIPLRVQHLRCLHLSSYYSVFPEYMPFSVTGYIVVHVLPIVVQSIAVLCRYSETTLHISNLLLGANLSQGTNALGMFYFYFVELSQDALGPIVSTV